MYMRLCLYDRIIFTMFFVTIKQVSIFFSLLQKPIEWVPRACNSNRFCRESFIYLISFYNMVCKCDKHDFQFVADKFITF